VIFAWLVESIFDVFFPTVEKQSEFLGIDGKYCWWMMTLEMELTLI